MVDFVLRTAKNWHLVSGRLEGIKLLRNIRHNPTQHRYDSTIRIGSGEGWNRAALRGLVRGKHGDEIAGCRRVA